LIFKFDGHNDGTNLFDDIENEGDNSPKLFQLLFGGLMYSALFWGEP
jgi:hypothetical protein